jgi:hypothetical protein
LEPIQQVIDNQYLRHRRRERERGRERERERERERGRPFVHFESLLLLLLPSFAKTKEEQKREKLVNTN